MSFIGILIIILLATTVFGHISARLGMPTVIGQLLIGIVIGPALLNIVQPSELISNFAEIGVILLMFIAGIESDMKQLRRFLKPAISVALCGVLLPIFTMGIASILFGYSILEATFIGAVFAATSVSISVVVLREFKTLDSKEGATILGAAVADDIIGVLILSLLIALDGSTSTTSMHSGNTLFTKFVFQGIFFISVFVLVRWIAPLIMHLSNKLLVPTSRTICALIICLSMAYIAEIVGLSGAIGAFFAGIAVGQTNTREIVDKYIESIGDAIFIPVFFVNIGLSISFDNFLKSSLFVVVMTILAILTKWLGGFLGSKLTGFSNKSSNIVGAGMIARGEMALITAQIGFSAHLLQKNLYVDIIFVIVLATVVAPLMLRNTLR